MPAAKKPTPVESVPVTKDIGKPAPKVAKKKVAVVVPEKAPEVVPVSKPETTVDENTENRTGKVVVGDFMEKVASLLTHIKGIQCSLKLIVKEFDKQKKIVDKVQKKKDKAKKSPSGFAKPCKISDELCDFIGVAKGTELSRTDITRHINSYVKAHNLNNPENRREFFPDKKLKSILNVKEDEKVTYFVLQRLIAHHFPPSLSKQAAAAAAAATKST